MKKRIIAFFLCLTMVMPLLPAYAEETAPPETAAPVETTAPVETDPTEESTEATDPTEESTEATDPTEESTEATDPTEESTEATDPTEESTEATDPTEESTEATDPTEESTEATDPTEESTEATDPVITEEEVDALYNALMGCNSTSELNTVVANVTEDKAEAFFAALSEEELDALTGHLLAVFQQEHPVEEKVVPESVNVYPTVSNTNAAPFKEPVTIAPVMRRFSFRAAPVAEETQDDGLELGKSVSNPNADGVYTLTLDAYATGAKTITEETTSVPTDIILVLDQSGSMAYDFTVSTYNQFTGVNAEEYYQQAMDSLYVKLEDDSYASVIVEKSVSVTNPVLAESQNNSEYKSLCDAGKLYHRCADGTYGLVTCESWDIYVMALYQFNCESCGEISNGFSFFGTDTTIPSNSESFYTSDVSTVMYTFSYVDQNGNTVTHGPATDVPEWVFYEAGSSGTSTRLAALKTAVETFTNNVKKKAMDDGINHRIAIVGFASPSGNGNNSEVLTLSGNNSTYNSGSIGISYSELTSEKDKYAGALQDMTTAEGRNMVANAINALAAEGATRVDLGMEMANEIFANDHPPVGERNRVIVVFTDGVPTTSNSYSETVASSAISYGTTAKNTYGATVYTVGIFDGANSTQDGNSNGNETQKANWFMHRLSSNTSYPQQPSYYLTASNSADLNKIFQEISQNIESGGSSTTLGAEAVLKDVITDQFVLPAGTAVSDITVYTEDCTGADTNGNLTFANKTVFDATVVIDGQTVTVTNFDYSANWCGTETINNETTYRGKRLVIEIPIEVRDGFLGGNNVYTNESSSGIYENSKATTALDVFPRPTVDVQIKDITVTAPDYNVYLLGGVDAATLEAGLGVSVGTVTLDMDADNYGLYAWQNAYVTIDDGSGQSGFANLTADATYTAKVTVTPDTLKPDVQGAATAKSGSGTGNVYVYKPVVTFNDSIKDAGATNTFVSDNFEEVFWMHESVAADTSETGMGTPPALTYEYYGQQENNLNASVTVADELPVKVVVKLGEATIDEYVTFYRNGTTCSFADCTSKEKSEVNVTNDRVNFVVHVDTFDLTITKALAEGVTLDEDQTFLFHIYQGEDHYMDVVIAGTGSVTIEGLKSGNYKVTEDTAWSWRYAPDQNDVTVNANNSSVTFTNSRPNDKWLDGNSYAENTFSDVQTSTT